MKEKKSCAKKQCSTRFSLIKKLFKKNAGAKKKHESKNTEKKKFPQNRPRKTGHILKTIEMCCLFFFPFLLHCKQKKSSQDGQRREKKKRTLCANNYASTNSNKKQPSLVAAEKRLCFKNTRTTSTRKPFYCTALPRNKFEGASKTDRGNKCRL